MIAVTNRVSELVIAGGARRAYGPLRCGCGPSWSRTSTTKRYQVSAIGTTTHLPALAEPHEREAVGHELEATLHELIDLSLIGKQLHWAVVGPLFRPLHLH